MKLSEAVRARRKDLGLTQAEAAELAGVSPRFVFDVERDKATVSLEPLRKLLNVLGLEIRVAVIDRG
jgi:y4mF family transcriptional regulator